MDVSVTDLDTIKEILETAGSELDWESFFPDNLKLIFIKEQLCGLILKNHIVIKHLVLMPAFQHQGLSKDLVESYYFI